MKAVAKGPFQIFIQKHQPVNLPWPVVPCTSHFASSNPHVYSASVSALTLLSLGDLPYYPYLTFVSTFLSVLCILLTSVLPIASGKEQGKAPKIHSQSGVGWVPCISLGRKNVNK